MPAPPASSITASQHQGCHMARVSQAGAWSGLQLLRHGDMQGFDSSSLARVVAILWPHHETRCLPVMAVQWRIWHRLYGATAARLTPDQKVGSSNLSAVICRPHGQLRPPATLLACPGVAAWSRHPARMRNNSGSNPLGAGCPACPGVAAWSRRPARMRNNSGSNPLGAGCPACPGVAARSRHPARMRSNSGSNPLGAGCPGRRLPAL